RMSHCTLLSRLFRRRARRKLIARPMSLAAEGVFSHVDCDVDHVRCADFATVDALARASLNARRLGARLRVVNATPELEAVIGFAGREEVLLGRRQRQAEEREEAFGVQERREADDPAV